MMDLYKSVTPFILVQFVVLVICMLFPELVTWLPNTVMN